jgi:hypothetical protein
MAPNLLRRANEHRDASGFSVRPLYRIHQKAVIWIRNDPGGRNLISEFDRTLEGTHATMWMS